ncbi:cholinesterase [Aspergillus sclerotioniger CBS 115572]|uniref:Carboxylic ester hydrolase n=1 Tax=Aspergillus sclerotioniger CBS 115572 TaxID=1450535 RepID=A0A317UYQ0_9EURO|nr:cholinesterase [Aspergillus sclerotioniger CBS 115572]PWY65622.1 cholinesterase [Aspergillus sclerotioniger CBS 115572]
MKAPYQWALFATSTLKNLETASPTVTISSPSATIIGELDNKDVKNVEVFKGIPFAEPPVPSNALRLKPPQPITTSLGTVQATGYPAACPQMDVRETKCMPLPPNIAALMGPTGPNPEVIDEDCLTLNIWRPKDSTPDKKYPVLFWIYGGSFEVGSNMDLPGGPIVEASINQDLPIIFVSANYRLGGFGFLPGQRVRDDESANLGLQDQRLALQWVADNIHNFGGDPSKVTIWGQSAGSHSVFHQMALYNGDHTYHGSPLFQGGIMNSGNTWPVDDVNGTRGEQVYKHVVENSPCSPGNDSLACLRDLKYPDFLRAVNSVPSRSGHFSLSLSYLPRPDGKVVTASPEEAVLNGTYAKVPFIVGDPEDDGSAVVMNMTNITTTDHVTDYLWGYYYRNAERSQIKELVSIYADDYEYGAPFHTPPSNSLYPQSKRLAAILGDFTVLLTRRFILADAVPDRRNVPSWSFIFSAFKGIPYLGSFHGSELYMREIWKMLQRDFPDLFPGDIEPAIASMWSYYFSFIYYQDPNKANQTLKWPQWTDNQQIMNFTRNGNEIKPDTFRYKATEFLVNNVESLRI